MKVFTAVIEPTDPFDESQQLIKMTITFQSKDIEHAYESVRLFKTDAKLYNTEITDLFEGTDPQA